MKKALWQLCCALLLTIGLTLWLIPGQTVFATDDENLQPPYKYLDEKQIYGNAEQDEVFITNILDENDIVECFPFGGECYGMEKYHRNTGPPIEFEIEIDRYFGPVDSEGKLKHPENIDNGTVQLTLRAFDVDTDFEIGSISYADGETVYPEIDEIYINDHPEPIGALRGFNGQWSLTTITIPVEYLRFPDLDENGYVVPAANTIKINVDVANSRFVWETVVERGWFTIKGIRPVVLVHGFVSDEHTWIEWTKPGGYIEEYGIPMHTFSFPNNHQNWRINADILGMEIEEALNKFGVNKVNVVGHSKGGLDTRGYLHVYKQLDPTVNNLFMLGTPNGGSPLASLGTTLKMHPYVHRVVPSKILEPALTQLTIGYMLNTFNQIVHENPNTNYYTLPGNCCSSLFMGYSDLIVPVHSVLRLPYAEDIGMTEDTHFSLTKNREVFDLVRAKLGIGFDSRGARTFGARVMTEDAFLQMGDSGISEVSKGETNNHEFRLQEDSSAQLIIMTETPVSVAVYDPSGQEVEIDLESYFTAEELFPRIEVAIPDPEPGAWILEISHHAEADAPIQYGWIVADSGGPTLEVEISPVITADDDLITIEAIVDGLDDLQNLNVQATIRLPDDTIVEDPVAFVYVGDGKYEGEYEPDNMQMGPYTVLVSIEHDDVKRQQLSAFTQLSSSERLPALYSAEGIDTDDDGLFDWLEVEVPLQIGTAGEYLLHADLYDQHNNLITSAGGGYELSSEVSTVVLQFSGEKLAASRFSGDLILRNVQLHNLTTSVLSDSQEEAATFSDFIWEQFQRPPIRVLDGIEDVGILDEENEENEGKFQRLSVIVPVHVNREAFYIFNARLIDSAGTELGYVGGNFEEIFLEKGDNHLTLDFNGEFIHGHGKAGPYFVKDFTLEEYYYFDEDEVYHDGAYSLVIANLHETNYYDADAFIPPRDPDQLMLTNVPFSVRIDEMIRIEGQVLDRHGNGIGGVVVEFSIDGGESVAEAMTFSGRDWREEGTFNAYIQPPAIGTVTITATVKDTDIIVTSRDINVVPVPASQLAFGIQPINATVGQILEPVHVYLMDEYDQHTTESGSVTLSITGDDTSLEGTTTVSAVDGVAIFNDLRIFTPGIYTLTAEIRINSQTRTSESESFTIAPSSHSGEIHSLSVNVNPTPVVAGDDLTVNGQVLDSAGQGVSGIIVEFFSDDVTEIKSAVTDTSGHYETSFSQEKAGTSQLIVTIQDSVISEKINYEVTPSAAHKVVYTVQPEHSIVGQPIHPLEARVVDRYGNHVGLETDISVRIESSSNSDASLQGTTTVTSNSDGKAIFDNLTIDQPGRFRLQVQVSQPSLASSTSQFFAVVPLADLKLTLEVDAEVAEMDTVEAGTRVTFSGKVTDEDDNTYVGLPIEFSANLGAAPSVVITDQEGHFTTPAYNIFRLTTAGHIKITATVQGTSTKETISFTVMPSETSKLTYVTQPKDGQVNQIMAPVQVQLLDLYNNPTNEEYEMTAYFLVDGFNVLESETVTPIDGVATFENLSIDTPGTYTLMAIIEINQTPRFINSEPFTIAPAETSEPVHTITVQASPYSVVAGNEVIVSGEVLDNDGHAIAGATVQFSVDQGSAPMQVVTELDGTYHASFSPTTAGTVQLTATVLGTDISDTTTIEVEAAAASILAFHTQPVDTTAGQTLDTIQVQLLDPHHNVATDALEVTISITDGNGGDLRGTTTVPAIKGLAVFNDLSIDTAGTYTLTAEVSGISGVISVISEFFKIEAEADSSTGTSPPSSPVFPTLPTSPRTEVIEGGVVTGENITMLTIERTQHQDGALTDQVTFDEEVAETVVNRARDTGVNIIRLTIPDTDDEVSEVNIDVPLAAAQMLAENKMAIEIFTDNAIIRLPSESLAGIDEDFYFRLVPVKDSIEQDEIQTRAAMQAVIRDLAGDDQIEVLARPMMIETNLSSYPVTLVLPLHDVLLPEQEIERAAFLAQLGIYIEHSDGEKEVVSGTAVSYEEGLLGLAFTVSKFSTFSIIQFGEAQFGTHTAYITGFPDGQFKPGEHVTRAQMAIMMAKNLGFDINTTANEASFRDVEIDHYAASAIAFVNAQGFVNGYPDGSFRASNAITRAEMAAIVANYMNLAIVNDEQRNFNDTAGHWARAAIDATFEAGIIVGYSDGSFRPQQYLTRAEAVVIVNRLFNRGPLYGAHIPSFPDVAETHWAYEHIQEASINHDYVIDLYQQEQRASSD